MKRVIPLVLLVGIIGAYVAYKRYLSGRPFEWAGTVEARAISVGSRTGGRVAKVLAQEGEQVKVKVRGVDDRGKVKLSMKTIDQQTGAELPREPRPPREGADPASAPQPV